MGLVQQAVLEFDEEIQAPWRPRLVAVAGTDQESRPRGIHPSGRSSSRVGVCRPGEPVRDASVPRGGPEVVIRRAVAGSGERRHRTHGAGSARRATGRGVRLTRRARRLAAVLTLALGVALGSWLGPLLAGGDGDLRLAGVQSVVVQPGDTLWSIAGRAAGSADVRDVVDRIQELNGLHGTVLMPGQVLELPSRPG
jgi:nucleoid-associated protein YgaU